MKIIQMFPFLAMGWSYFNKRRVNKPAKTCLICWLNTTGSTAPSPLKK